MRIRRTLSLLLWMVITLAACSALPVDVQQAVQGTMQALTAQVPLLQTEVSSQLTQAAPTPTQGSSVATSTPVPSAATGGISGQLILEQKGGWARAIAFEVGTDKYYSVDLQPGQQIYQIDNLPPGIYHVLAYEAPSAFAVGANAAYSQAVLCGMGPNCTDHSLVDVIVIAGQVTPGVDLLETYQMPEYPQDPLAFAGGTDNIPTQTPPSGQSGSISGQLSYPAEGIPAMAVIAYKVGGSPGEYYFVTTDQGDNTYQIDNLPAGEYHIIAYTMGGGGFPAGLAGGYSQAVPCGLSVSCTDHSLIPVQVTNGQITPDANPQDWYAPDGTFPAYPLP